MLSSILYLLSYLSKGLSKVKDQETTEKKYINYLLEDAELLKILVFYLFWYNIYRSPLRNDWNYAKLKNVAAVKTCLKNQRL